jgi:hypothetical protein
MQKQVKVNYISAGPGCSLQGLACTLPAKPPLVPMNTAPIVILFYTKPDCPLCEDAETLLEVAGHHWPIEVRRVNILQDRACYDLYWNRIPVLEFPSGATLEPPRLTRENLTAVLRRQSGT